MLRHSIIILCCWPLGLLAQVPSDTTNLSCQKNGGTIQSPFKHHKEEGGLLSAENDPGVRSSETGFFIELDDTFTQTMEPNDDDSFGPLDLGFTFCFYGTEYNQVYINNNGNISFLNPYYEYSPIGFPSDQYIMIASFWGDVDTRTQPPPDVGTGLVWHRLETDPYRLTLIFDHVGYYNMHADKLNTFQLIITDGNDPLIGIGNNVAFAYEEMEWTTGDASGGVGGFGGFPATVGVNKGDGESHALVGRFDKPGDCFNGPYGAPSCVGYLNYRRYIFDACDEEVIIDPPDEPQVSTHEATDVTASSAVLGGEVLSGNGEEISEYGIYWGSGPNPLNSGIKVPIGSGAGSFSLLISELESLTTYYFLAYAVNEAGTGYGITRSFTTLGEPPVVITSEPEDITANSAILGGDVVSDGGLFVEERGILWSTYSDPIMQGAQETVGQGTGWFSLTMESLMPGTDYYFTAFAENELGRSFGEIKQFTTNAELGVLPNAFMPSSNIPANQLFKPSFNLMPQQYSLSVYNQWGRRVFHTGDPNVGWDGMDDGVVAPAGGYNYFVEYRDSQGNEHKLRGVVILIR